MSLVPYDSDMDEENAAEAAAIAGALDSSSSSNEDEAGDGSHMQLRPESGSERESHGKSADEEETNADDAVAPPVPVALTGAGDDDDDDDDDERGGRADDPEEQPTLVLPPPDFSDWSADPAQMAAAARPAAPKVSVLGKQKRQGGPHQISRGFSAAVTRHDQLKAAAREEWERQQEARGRNNGFSSAYESVFHGPEAGEDQEQARRTKVTRKGTVRTLSKKEAAQLDALEATLRD